MNKINNKTTHKGNPRSKTKINWAGSLLTAAEAADRLGTSVRFIRRLVAQRRIPYLKVGRHLRISRDDLDAFIGRGTGRSRSPLADVRGC